MKHYDYHPFRSEAAKRRYLARYDERAAAWPVPSEERIVDTSFGSTFVRVSGHGDAPPLIILPGVYNLLHLTGVTLPPHTVRGEIRSTLK